MNQEYSVLVVDDSTFTRHTIKKYLADTEFKLIAEAGNGAEAVELHKTHGPDLVLLDVVMPKMDGAEALEGLLGADPSCRVVMLSSLGTEATVTTCLALGARSFIQKPCSKDELIRCMRDVVRREAD
jgi:two-component system chemotaxis response regulator CheY